MGGNAADEPVIVNYCLLMTGSVGVIEVGEPAIVCDLLFANGWLCERCIFCR